VAIFAFRNQTPPVHIPSLEKLCVKITPFLLSPQSLASLRHATSLGKDDGRKIFF
jgi:hypothetical protein